MKKLLTGVLMMLILASCSNHDEGEVTIQLPDNYPGKTLVVSHITIDNIFKAKSADDLKVVYDTLKIKDGKTSLKLDIKEPAWYNIESPVSSIRQPEFYVSPGESLSVVIKSFSPCEYDVKGTKLMEDIMAVNAATWPIRQQYIELISSDDEVPVEKARDLLNRYDDAIKKFVKEHPKSQAVPYAILDLSGDDFKVIYDSMTPEARSSILMPYADSYNAEVVKMLEERDAEQAQKDKESSGTIVAPIFNLPDLQGKTVSLSDFRGKWVVLDFWGSWCGWCIKGFPALKQAYEKYGDKLVVIGIDCNESEEDWKEGVKKHQIPWINLYNGMDEQLYKDYNVTGFPTKVIINPEGKIVDKTTGEDPSFYIRLEKLING